MRASLLPCGLLAAASARVASSALVDASKFTGVTVDTPLYDTNLGDMNGCDPTGCQGSLTRVSPVAVQSATLQRSGSLFDGDVLILWQ